VLRSSVTRLCATGSVRASLALICVALSFGPPSARAQTPPAASLRVAGKVERPLVIGEAGLAALPRKRLMVTDDKGASVTYEGVLAVELFR
jgi:hypothetical protein